MTSIVRPNTIIRLSLVAKMADKSGITKSCKASDKQPCWNGWGMHSFLCVQQQQLSLAIKMGGATAAGGWCGSVIIYPVSICVT